MNIYFSVIVKSMRSVIFLIKLLYMYVCIGQWLVRAEKQAVVEFNLRYLMSMMMTNIIT